MRKVVTTIALVGALTVPLRLFAAEQDRRIEAGPVRAPTNVGIAIAASMMNLVYVPVRLVVTTCTAVAGGTLGFLSLGNVDIAESIWGSTEGQAIITPAILERRERLQFGPRR